MSDQLCILNSLPHPQFSYAESMIFFGGCRKEPTIDTKQFAHMFSSVMIKKWYFLKYNPKSYM